MNRIWVRLWLAILGIFWSLLIALEIPTTLVRSSFANSSETFLLITDAIGTLLLSVLFTALPAWYLARPLSSLSKAARQLAEGDLSARVCVEEKRFRLGMLQSGEINRLLYDFNSMATSLERLETERLATTASIAHELRTPIAVLGARLAALRDGVFELTPSEVPPLIKQTDQLARLVDDLRHLSLADAGRLELSKAPCDVAALAEEVVSSFESHAATKDIDLKTVLASVTIDCDPVRMRQVVSNLLDNAFKVTPHGGLITVSVQAVGRGVRLELRDSGPGFDNVERVFERFFHGDSGSGLGLAIVKTFVELHGGKVEAGNAAEGGAVVRVFLPER